MGEGGGGNVWVLSIWQFRGVQAAHKKKTVRAAAQLAGHLRENPNTVFGEIENFLKRQEGGGEGGFYKGKWGGSGEHPLKRWHGLCDRLLVWNEAPGGVFLPKIS